MSEKPQVWIATPTKHIQQNGQLTAKVFASLHDHYRTPIESMQRMADKLPFSLHLFVTGGGSVFRARNRAASEFMAATNNPDDMLFFEDYDLMPSEDGADHLKIILRNLPICGGLYTTRADNGHFVLNEWPGAVPSPSGLLQVMELGTGFKCFKRSVFQKVLEDNPWLDCESDFDRGKRELCFFSAGPVWDKRMWPGVGRCLTEDYWFDWLCRESGIMTVVDTTIKLRHKDDFTGKIFPKVWPADPGELPKESEVV